LEQVAEWVGSAVALLPADFYRALGTTGATFLLIAAAEIGDKSQLVCMALAARHRGLPVLCGAASAFALLNLLAVLFGAALAAWVPEQIIAGVVALLFGSFGILAFLKRDEDDQDSRRAVARSHGSVFFSTFLLIVVAEFGDKTQLAVAGMGSAAAPLPVWLGATTALVTTSALGVWAGRAFLQRISLRGLHRASGALFLALAVYALWRAVPPDWRETGLVVLMEAISRLR
jgi:putative Ca2+/H+ antiporter (TMEM165/GDT1 family)